MELPMLFETGLEVITERWFSNVGQIAVLIFVLLPAFAKYQDTVGIMMNSVSFRSCHKD